MDIHVAQALFAAKTTAHPTRDHIGATVFPDLAGCPICCDCDDCLNRGGGLPAESTAVLAAENTGKPSWRLRHSDGGRLRREYMAEQRLRRARARAFREVSGV